MVAERVNRISGGGAFQGGVTVVGKTKMASKTKKVMPSGSGSGGSGSGGCLTCSKKVEKNLLVGGIGGISGMKQLEKAIRKVFKYLMVPEECWDVLGSSVIGGVPFCASCFETIQEIMNLELAKDGIELKIQSKVESLGRVVAQTPPHMFICGSPDGTGGGFQQNKQSLEMWKYFRDPVMQNFVKGKLPNPSVNLEMLKRDENAKYGYTIDEAQVASTSGAKKLNMTSGRGGKNNMTDRTGRDPGGSGGAQKLGGPSSGVVPKNSGRGPPVQWKIQLGTPKRQQQRGNKGRGRPGRKPGPASKKRILPKKKPQIKDLVKKEQETNAYNMDQLSTDNDSDDSMFEEIIVRKDSNGGIISLTPTKRNSNLNSGEPAAKRSRSRESSVSSNSSDMFQPVFITPEGIKKLQNQGKVKVPTPEKERSDDNDEIDDEDDVPAAASSASRSTRSEGMMEYESERIPIPGEIESTTVFSMVCSTDPMISPRKDVVGIEGQSGNTSSIINGREKEINLTPESIRLKNSNTNSPTTSNRSPCVPVDRNDSLDILASVSNGIGLGEEQSHSQEIMDLMFTPGLHNDQPILPVEEDIHQPSLGSLDFSFSEALNSFVLENELNTFNSLLDE